MLEHEDCVQAVSWSSGDIVATGCDDGNVSLFNSVSEGPSILDAPMLLPSSTAHV